MDPFISHLSASHFRPEAYVASNRPSRPAGAAPSPGSAREVDRDRRPSQPAYGEATAELGFADLLDVINPLQHIPLVGDLYRTLTDDQITAPARVAGGAIFGGPLGFVSGIVNALADEIAGQDFGAAVVAAILGEDKEEPGAAQAIASNSVPPATQPVLAAAPASPQPQPLTGAAALRALGADLRLIENPVTPIPAALTPAAAHARPLAPPPRTGFSDRMIEGLSKYNTLVTEKNAPQAPPIEPMRTKL